MDLKRIHTFSLTALAAAFLLCSAALLSAAELVVVKSSGIKPYNDALEGFKSTCMCTVTELNLPEIGKENIQEQIIRIRPVGVLAIGMDALRSVSTMKDPPIFYTMVTEYGPGFPVNMKNLSGFSMDILPETYLRNMAGLFPAAKRIGIIYSRQNTGKLVKDATAISRSIGLEIVAREVSGPGEVPAVIESLKGRIDMFWMLPDTMVCNTPDNRCHTPFFISAQGPCLFLFRQVRKNGGAGVPQCRPFSPRGEDRRACGEKTE